MAERPSEAELTQVAKGLGMVTIESTSRAGSGHPSSGLSALEIVTSLYFGGVLRHDPQRPDWPDRDRFVLSKGHGCPVLYAALAERGYFPRDWVNSLRRLDAPLEGHPNMLKVPGLEASTGSLGQGLSIALGIALAARFDGRDYRVYALIGDGESDEGQVWEAAMTAAKYKVENLTAIVDRNLYQQTGATEEVMPALEPLADKWSAFGWHVLEVDGHDYEALFAAFEEVRNISAQPQVIIARTVKGHRVSLIEEDPGNKFHGIPLKPEEAEEAIRELQEKMG
ncbi:MAG: transketolase [Anaerolineae bacterium]